MPLDQELCRYYIGRDADFWQQVNEALERTLRHPEAEGILHQLGETLLVKQSTKEGAMLLTRFANLDREAGPLVPLGALGLLLPKAILPYQQQGADDEMLKQTFGDIRRWINWYKREHGIDGLEELTWAVRPYANKLYHIGCLQFERIENRMPVQVWQMSGSILLLSCGGVYVDHNQRACARAEDASFITGWKQTEHAVSGHLIDPETGLIDPTVTTLPTAGMTRILRPGDAALTLHIPAGTSLLPDDVDRSLRSAKEFFAAAGMSFSTCQCHSWMLDPQLSRFMDSSSRILNLSRRFAHVSMAGEGSGARFIFGTDTPPLRLPPEAVKTSLQQAVMRHLKMGGKLYDFGGVMLL